MDFCSDLFIIRYYCRVKFLEVVQMIDFVSDFSVPFLIGFGLCTMSNLIGMTLHGIIKIFRQIAS